LHESQGQKPQLEEEEKEGAPAQMQASPQG
jgi:hypothetical protein